MSASNLPCTESKLSTAEKHGLSGRWGGGGGKGVGGKPWMQSLNSHSILKNNKIRKHIYYVGFAYNMIIYCDKLRNYSRCCFF